MEAQTMKWILCLAHGSRLARFGELPLLLKTLLAVALLCCLTGCSTIAEHMPPIPNEATYGMGYRFQTDTERKILDGGYLVDINLQTNDYHMTVRTPNFTRTVPSQTIDEPGVRDSWRANGLELGYGKPLWQTDESLPAYARLNWELNGGILIAYERIATENVRTVETVLGLQEIRERRNGDTKYLPTAGVGLGLKLGVDTPGGGQYRSVGLMVRGGYRVVGEFGETPYVDVGLVLGL